MRIYSQILSSISLLLCCIYLIISLVLFAYTFNPKWHHGYYLADFGIGFYVFIAVTLTNILFMSYLILKSHIKSDIYTNSILFAITLIHIIAILPIYIVVSAWQLNQVLS